MVVRWISADSLSSVCETTTSLRARMNEWINGFTCNKYTTKQWKYLYTTLFQVAKLFFFPLLFRPHHSITTERSILSGRCRVSTGIYIYLFFVVFALSPILRKIRALSFFFFSLSRHWSCQESYFASVRVLCDNTCPEIRWTGRAGWRVNSGFFF